jgi:ribosomal protein L9
MDVKQYYRKLREVEAGLADRFPLVVSVETPDGGKAGMLSEVPRGVAAKLLVEGRAVLANEQQKEQYRLEQEAAKKASEQARLARSVQVAIISDSELHARAGKKVPGDTSSGK